jgi:hypothetical protein
MFSIPPYVLLFPYAVFLLGCAFFSMINIVHLLRYGAKNIIGFIATFGYICAISIIMFFTWNLLQTVDWRASMPLFQPSSAAVPYLQL